MSTEELELDHLSGPATRCRSRNSSSSFYVQMTTLHELGHGLGFRHEHQSIQTDGWIRLDLKNITSGEYRIYYSTFFANTYCLLILQKKTTTTPKQTSNRQTKNSNTNNKTKQEHETSICRREWAIVNGEFLHFFSLNIEKLLSVNDTLFIHVPLLYSSEG